jgi:CTP synthase
VTIDPFDSNYFFSFLIHLTNIGARGFDGKVVAIQYARENHVPFFGICLGLQAAVVEFTRNVLGIANATSSEFDEKAEHPVVTYMPEISTTHLGGTMRLGAKTTQLKANTLARSIYDDEPSMSERHRHRYEVNNKYVDQLEKAGLVFSGTNGDLDTPRMECVELPTQVHPFFFATQAHPEFKSRPILPSPCFVAFIGAANIKRILINEVLASP